MFVDVFSFLAFYEWGNVPRTHLIDGKFLIRLENLKN